jgi:hypothetical protein
VRLGMAKAPADRQVSIGSNHSAYTGLNHSNHHGLFAVVLTHCSAVLSCVSSHVYRVVISREWISR